MLVDVLDPVDVGEGVPVGVELLLGVPDDVDVGDTVPVDVLVGVEV